MPGLCRRKKLYVPYTPSVSIFHHNIFICRIDNVK